MGDSISGYFMRISDLRILYVPQNVIVLSDDGCYDVRTLPNEIKLFDEYWRDDKICLFEGGVVNSFRPLDYWAKVNIPLFWVYDFAANCWEGNSGSDCRGRPRQADLEAISIFEEVLEEVERV